MSPVRTPEVCVTPVPGPATRHGPPYPDGAPLAQHGSGEAPPMKLAGFMHPFMFVGGENSIYMQPMLLFGYPQVGGVELVSLSVTTTGVHDGVGVPVPGGDE